MCSLRPFRSSAVKFLEARSAQSIRMDSFRVSISRRGFCGGEYTFPIGQNAIGGLKNDVVAAPVMTVMMLMTANKSIMGRNVHYRFGGRVHYLCICFGKVKCDTLSDQLITFTRRLCEALSVKYRDLPSAALNQTGAFQIPGSNGDGWPLDAQHFGEEILRNLQCVLVIAVTHHEQPTRQPLLEAVCTVASHRHHDLFKKGLDVSGHKISEGGHSRHECELTLCAISAREEEQIDMVGARRKQSFG
jgi:hypothetical protein